MLRKILISALFSAAAAQVTVTDCAAGKSAFTVKSLDFSPVTPIAGTDGTLHTVYDVPAPVTAGKARYSCVLNGLPVYDETMDLCSQTTCPIVTGTHDDKSTAQVPKVSGKIACKIEWTGSDGSELMCIQTVMKFAASSTEKYLRGVSQGPIHFVPPVQEPSKALVLYTNGTCPKLTVPPLEDLDFLHPAPADPRFFPFADADSSTTGVSAHRDNWPIVLEAPSDSSTSTTGVSGPSTTGLRGFGKN